MNTQNNLLKELLNSLFTEFSSLNIEYCVIGNYKRLPDYTENDVDIWVNDTEAAHKVLLKLANGAGLNLYNLNKTANGTNNYFYNNLDGNIQIVKVDLMSETAYRSIIPIVPSNLILTNRIAYKNFYVANTDIEGVMHLIYPLVTFGEVKDQYKEKLTSVHDSDNFYNLIAEITSSELAEEIILNLKNMDWDSVEEMAPRVKRALYRKTLLSFSIQRLNIFFKFLLSLLNRTINKNGIVISFTGIDGAGKTTIKEHFITNSNKYFTKNRKVEFYWRPFALPRIAKIVGSKGQKEDIDKTGKRILSSGFASSIKNSIKYIYYVSDFIIGQMKYFTPAHTGGLVIFDRYHFDNIIYPERFGFKINRTVMRFIDKYIIPQPDILFYFTADTKILYERKHEIDINEINNQKKIYSKEVERKKTITTIDTGCSFDESVNNVLLECLKTMSKRYKNNGL